MDIPEKFKDKNKINKFREDNKTYLTNISNKINKFGISEEDYVKNRYTALQLSQDNKAPISNKYEFIKSFNQLNKLLDIDIQIPLIQDEKPNFKPLPDSLDDFQTKPDKILALDSVQDYIKISPDTLTDIDIKQEDIIKLYSDKIPDTITAILSKNNLDQSLIQYFDISNFNSKTWFLDKSKFSQITDKNLLDQLQQISETITDKFTTDWKKEILIITNKTIKEKIMSSVFRWISDFFDITNDNIENFANDFKLDFDQDLKFKNNVVNIRGQINWSYVWLSYDLINWKLSIDDLVSFNSKDKLYKIWKQSWSVLNIPITLPTLKDFKDDSLKFDYKTLVSGSDNIDQYKNDLNKQLWSVFYWNFVHRELNQYYIRQSNEKNLAVQSGLSYMFDNFQSATWSDYTFDFYWAQELSFTEALNSDHFRLIKMVDDSFDYYNQSSNFLKIRNLFEQFNMLINTRSVSQWQSSEKLINILFNYNEMKNSSNAWQSMWNNWNFNYLRFYDLISKSSWWKKIIDIDILDKLVGVIEKWESFSDPNNRKKFTSSFRNKYESIINDPDKNLENKLKEI